MAPSTARKASDRTATISTTFSAGDKNAVASGNAAPVANDAADASAACRGRARRISEMPEFIARMSAERILRHQLRRNFRGEPRIEAAFDVDRCKLPVFGVEVVLEFLAFTREIRVFRVGLRADRDVFTRRHGHRAGHEAGKAGDQDGAAVSTGGGDADYETRCRDDSVVRTKDRRPKPVDAT